MGNSLGIPTGVFTNQAANAIQAAIAGAGLATTTGNIFYCDPINGTDTNTGTAGQNVSSGVGPVQSLAQGYALLSEGHNDVLVLIGNGLASGTARVNATFTWSKDAAHLVGVCSGSPLSQRARIAPGTAAAAFANFFVVSGNGCFFSNVQWFQGFATGIAAEICMTVSGSRNVFSNCSISGMGDTSASAGAASTTSRNLKITAGENYFVGCTIGIDTIARSVANASVEISSGAARNIFRGCIFPSLCTSASALGLLVANAAGIDRFTLFDGCFMINAIQSTGTAQTVWASIAASAGGMILMQNCASVGSTAISSSGEVYVSGPTTTSSAFLAQAL